MQQLHELFTHEESELLQQRARRVAAPLREVSRAGHMTTLLALMRGEKYALPIDLITVVYEDIPIIPVPCVPNFVAGIANVRGHIVSVLDLAALLNLEAVSSGNSALVVADAGDTTIGFSVEAVGDVTELRMSDMNPVPPNMNLGRSEYVQGLFADGVALLNFAAVLADPRIRVDEAAT